jgi:large conductance mechanosensitive channel
MGILKEFKEFALRGNVVDMAVGIVIGAAFTAIVTSLVSDVMMPPLGLAMRGVDFGQMKVELKEAVPAHVNEANEQVPEKPAVNLHYGKFINAAVHFVIVAFCVFLLVKGINTLKRTMEKKGEPAAPTQKDCPYCLSSINIKATRCPQCTSELETAAAKG